MTDDPTANDHHVGPLDPLRVGPYRRMWLASVVSGLGTFIQLTAAPWLMLELTGSALYVSLVTTALFLPQLLLTLPAGAIADVFDRRTILLSGQAVAVVAVSAMTVLAATEQLTPELLLALLFLTGVGNAIGQPAFQTLVPDLVPRAMLTQAITLTAAAFNVSRAIGPSIGGVLIAAGLTSVAFGLNAASYLGLIGVLLLLPRGSVEEPGRLTLWRSTATGVRYARFTREVRSLLLITAGFSLTAACVQALLPALVDADLQGDATDFGILYAAYGFGALTAALTRDRANLLLGRHMLAGVVVGFGGAGMVLGLARSLPVAAIALYVAGTCFIWAITTLNASVQRLAPAWVRGRIVSLFVLTFGVQPIGALLAGVIAERTTAGTSIAILTGVCLLLGLGLLRAQLPSLSELRAPVTGEPGWGISHDRASVPGSPIVVATTWHVDPPRLAEFLELMRELRFHRLRTGATRWALFHDSEVTGKITEMYSVPDWPEHLAQHGRLDRDAVDAIARARSFDRHGTPTSRHLAGIDLSDRNGQATAEAFVTAHQQLHRTDGSLPLPDEDDDLDPRRTP